MLRCSVTPRASLSCLGQAVRTCIPRMSGEAQTRCVSVSGGELLHVPGAQSGPHSGEPGERGWAARQQTAP